MELTEKQSNFILDSQFCVVATSDKKGQPRACIVMPEMAFGDKVIIADCQMQKTSENIKANPKVFLSFYDNDLDWCMKCEGVAEYIDNVENPRGGESCNPLEINWKQKVCRLQELSSRLSNQSTSIVKILKEFTPISKEQGYDVAGIIIISLKDVHMCQ